MTHKSDRFSVEENICPPIHGKLKTALFAGSFNPFTRGHLRIVERALLVADRVIVAVGCNITKAEDTGKTECHDRIGRISEAVAFLNRPGEPERVTVTRYSGLTAEFARAAGADFLVRGVRNLSDFEYERNLADVNLKILGIDTVFFCAEPEYSYISSSTIRELDSYGYDTTSLLPE